MGWMLIFWRRDLNQFPGELVQWSASVGGTEGGSSSDNIRVYCDVTPALSDISQVFGGKNDKIWGKKRGDNDFLHFLIKF